MIKIIFIKTINMASIDQNPFWYSDATKSIKKLIAEELKKGNFKHLKNPVAHTKSGSQDSRYRFSVMLRPSTNACDGKRNLNSGSSELLFMLEGVSTVDGDWRKGIIFPDEDSYRLVMGEKIRSPDFACSFLEEFRSYLPIGKRVLAKGRYDIFAKRMAAMAEEQIDVFKNILVSGFYRA